VVQQRVPDAEFCHLDINEFMRPGSLTLDVASALLTNLQGWARSAGFAVPKCTGDAYKHVEYDLRAQMDVFRRSGRTIYFLFDEVQRFFQVIDDPDGVLFKTLLQVGNGGRQGLHFAFTGSGMVRAWEEIAQCPANGTTVAANSFPINLPATDSPEVLAYATKCLLQHYDDFDPNALRELLDHAPSVAGGSYLAKLWSETVSHLQTLSEVSASASRKYWTEFRTNMLPLLTEMSKTDAQGEHSSLLRLRQLAEGTQRRTPSCGFRITSTKTFSASTSTRPPAMRDRSCTASPARLSQRS
jgi:hypothetical protein